MPGIRLLLCGVITGLVVTACTANSSGSISPNQSSSHTPSKEASSLEGDRPRLAPQKGSRTEKPGIMEGEVGRTSELDTDSAKSLRNAVLVGALSFNRIFAVSPEWLIKQSTIKHQGKFKTIRVSEVVGAPSFIASIADTVFIATTNQAQLIRLKKWSKPDTLSISAAFGGGERRLSYGSLVPYGTRLLVTVASGSEIAVVDVDTNKWSIRKAKVFSDRFSAVPSACLTADDRLAVVWSHGVDFLDPRSLDRISSANIPGQPAGIACTGAGVWVSDIFAPHGFVVDSKGAVLSEFRWRGKGSYNLFFDPGTQTVYGSDSVAGTVFGCGVNSRFCTTSSVIGQKPTSLITVNGRILVSLEGDGVSDGRIGVVDLPSLRTIGSVTFPGPPRAFAKMGR